MTILTKENAEANAERIVHCVNHYDELLEAMKRLSINKAFDIPCAETSKEVLKRIAFAKQAIPKLEPIK